LGRGDDAPQRRTDPAAAEGRTLTSLIEEGLRLIVDDSRKTAKRRRVLRRVSKAGGGLMPGIDLTNSPALQEADDLAYVVRMQNSR
jgi:hypothetical protein